MKKNCTWIPQLWNVNTDMPWGNNYSQEVKNLLREYSSEKECKEACASIETLMRKEGWTGIMAYPLDLW